MPVQSYLNVALRWWKPLLAITLIPTILVVILVFFILTPVYEGKTKVIFPLKRAAAFMARSLADLDVPVSSMARLLDTTPTIYNHIAIMKSRNVSLRVYDYMLNNEGVDLFYTYKSLMRDKDLDTPEKRRIATAEYMMENVEVDDAEQGMAEIIFPHTDRELAAKISSVYVDVTLEFLRELNRNTQGDLENFLSAKLAVVSEKLEKAESEIQAMKEKTGIIMVDETARQLIKSSADIESLLAQAEIDYQGSLTTAQAMDKAGMDMSDYYRMIERGNQPENAKSPVPALDSLSDETVATLRKQLADLEFKRQQLMLYSTIENPEVIIINAQIDALYKELYREFSDYYDAQVASLMVEATSYKAMKSVAEQLRDEVEQRLDAFPPDERKIIELERDRDVQESIYLVLTQELEQAKIQKEHQESPFTVLDSALVPEKPVRPRKVVSTVGTFGISLWIGLLIVFSLDARRRNQLQAGG